MNKYQNGFIVVIFLFILSSISLFSILYLRDLSQYIANKSVVGINKTVLKAFDKIYWVYKTKCSVGVIENNIIKEFYGGLAIDNTNLSNIKISIEKVDNYILGVVEAEVSNKKIINRLNISNYRGISIEIVGNKVIWKKNILDDSYHLMQADSERYLYGKNIGC